MPNFERFISKTLEFTTQTFKDDAAYRRDKEAFKPFGTQIYIGRQGSGKTLSMVKHAYDLSLTYPNVIICSNIQLNEDYFPDYIKYTTIDELRYLLHNVQNGKYGVVYLCDEAQTYFNALDSKGIPLDIFQYISQQRKQHKLFLGSSQLFARLAKPWREQCDLLIACRTGFDNKMVYQTAYDAATLNQDYDGSFDGVVAKRGRFFQRPEYRNFYDTYEIITSATPDILLQNIENLPIQRIKNVADKTKRR